MYKKHFYVVKLTDKDYIRDEQGRICEYRIWEAKRKLRLWHGLRIERFNYLSHVLGKP